VRVDIGMREAESVSLNRFFNYFIVHRRPYLLVKAAMSLDGKIADAWGESKWITGPEARTHGMRLRGQVDAILVGINTVLADNPSLTYRPGRGQRPSAKDHVLWRVVLDSRARLPLDSRLASDEQAGRTIVAVGADAPARRVKKLRSVVTVWELPAPEGRVDVAALLERLGSICIGSLLVEGGGEVNAAFLMGGFAQEIAFFYAPRIIGGRCGVHAVEGQGARSLETALRLTNPKWRRLGEDLFLSSCLAPAA
jgi:diaminohydroxyphosphoribosylaminopyrimidine deaminase/5-amino-6-(5-phosphoribosylamino)uracil reductase